MSLVIKSLDPSDPFGSQVTQFFAGELPANIETLGSVVDSVTAAFVASNKVRYGSAPNIESLFVMRSAIRYCVENNLPIRILCPWGSKKPLNCKSLDVAEVMGLKALACLQARVQKVYEPGIIVNLRIEDTSGWHLFAGQEGLRSASERYVKEFILLIQILGYNFINPLLESFFAEETEFFSFAEEVKLVFLDYIQETDKHGFDNIDTLPSWNRLQNEYKWSGVIPVEMRDFFRNQYDKMYDGVSMDHKNELLSRYFAEAVARIKFNATGKGDDWEKNFLQLNFLQAAPGTPFSLTSNRITYRPIPENMCRTCIPPWRGKGFVQINENEVKPKITSWFDPEIINFHESTLVFSSGLLSVNVRADQKII